MCENENNDNANNKNNKNNKHNKHNTDIKIPTTVKDNEKMDPS